MNKMNNAVKSESVSSYFSCYTNEDKNSFPGEQTKIITNTKSRLYIRYDHDGIEDGSCSTKNTRELNSYKNYNPQQFATTLCILQPRGSSARHKLRTTSSSDSFSKKSPSVRYIKQTSHLHSHGIDEERDIDTFRRLSASQTERKSFTQRATLKSSHFKKGKTNECVHESVC